MAAVEADHGTWETSGHCGQGPAATIKDHHHHGAWPTWALGQPVFLLGDDPPENIQKVQSSVAIRTLGRRRLIGSPRLVG